jgi:hypothetical protein
METQKQNFPGTKLNNFVNYTDLPLEDDRFTGYETASNIMDVQDKRNKNANLMTERTRPNNLFTREEQQGDNGSMLECPICKGRVVSMCNCRVKESSCMNGHSWYNEDGIRKVGKPKH